MLRLVIRETNIERDIKAKNKICTMSVLWLFAYNMLFKSSEMFDLCCTYSVYVVDWIFVVILMTSPVASSKFISANGIPTPLSPMPSICGCNIIYYSILISVYVVKSQKDEVY